MSDAAHVRYVRPNGKTAFNMLVDNGATLASIGDETAIGLLGERS